MTRCHFVFCWEGSFGGIRTNDDCSNNICDQQKTNCEGCDSVVDTGLKGNVNESNMHLDG